MACLKLILLLLLWVDWQEDPFFGEFAYSRPMSSQPYSVQADDTPDSHHRDTAPMGFLAVACFSPTAPLATLSIDIVMPVLSDPACTLHLLMSSRL
jgi:hypothetical protein